MHEEVMCLNCSLSPERPSWAYRCGVFFDVVNKTDRTILVTGFNAGSFGGDRDAMLYACSAGTSVGHETSEEDWKVLWSGVLKERSSTAAQLHVLMKLAPHATQGFLLVSKDYAVYHTTSAEAVEDDSIKICAGVRSTEHRGQKNPFDPDAQSTEKATHAGSISYMFGRSYIVMCEASAANGDGVIQVTCCNMAGVEFAALVCQASETVDQLRGKVATALSSQLSDIASLQLELVAPDGQILSDESPIETLLGK